MARIKLKYVNGFSNRNRKSQRVRYYFRRRGMKAIPIPGLPGSEKFMTAYSMAMATIPDSAEISASRTSPGTINALAIDYYRSQAWRDLTAETRKKRWRIIERFVPVTATSVSRCCAKNTLRKCWQQLPSHR
jgi:hypothetical protein